MTSIQKHLMPHQMTVQNNSTASRQNTKKSDAPSFNQALHQAFSDENQTPLKISKHAMSRMKERNITIPQQKWQQIHQKMQEAKSMGIKDSLVLTQKEAMVVNAAKDTVVTVMHRDESQSRIFSNINGTILIEH